MLKGNVPLVIMAFAVTLFYREFGHISLCMAFLIGYVLNVRK